MSKVRPADLQAVKAELGQALLRDHEALKANLGSAIRRDHSRRKRRRKAIRTSALGLGVVLVLSGSALAADALGVIELGGGVSAVQVSTRPVWDGTTGTFITGTSENGSYIYHLTGGSNPTSTCGPTDPNPTNNIYVTSTRRLTSTELKEVLDTELRTEPRSVIVKEMEEGKLPNGAKWLRRGRYPMIGGGSSAPQKPLPAGVTSVSNGCPTPPGVARQPGTPGSPAAPGKAGVTVAPSDTGATP